jgi:hypothetical protein
MHTRRVTAREPIPTRRAPAGMRLPVPVHVRLWGAVLGALTMALGLALTLEPVPHRTRALDERSVVAVIELPLGLAMIGAGLWVIIATAFTQARASAHAVAGVVHGAHLGALAATFVIAYPWQPVPPIVTAGFAVIAHGGACLDYWQRGWR